jgi:hypothetical protein
MPLLCGESECQLSQSPVHFDFWKDYIARGGQRGEITLNPVGQTNARIFTADLSDV